MNGTTEETILVLGTVKIKEPLQHSTVLQLYTGFPIQRHADFNRRTLRREVKILAIIIKMIQIK